MIYAWRRQRGHHGRRRHAARSTAGRARGGPAPHRRDAPAEPRRRTSPRVPISARCSLARSATSTSCVARRASSPRSCRRASRQLWPAPSGRTRAASAADSTRCSTRAAQLAAAVERVERDLLAERMARVEDLEVLVDLVSGGLTRAARRPPLGAPGAGRAAGRRRPAAPLHGRARAGRAEAGGPTPARRVCACAQASRTRRSRCAALHPDAT